MYNFPTSESKRLHPYFGNGKRRTLCCPVPFPKPPIVLHLALRNPSLKLLNYNITESWPNSLPPLTAFCKFYIVNESTCPRHQNN